MKMELHAGTFKQAPVNAWFNLVNVVMANNGTSETV